MDDDEPVFNIDIREYNKFFNKNVMYDDECEQDEVEQTFVLPKQVHSKEEYYDSILVETDVEDD